MIVPRILYFDIETTPCVGWFWRPGYNQTITHEQLLEPAKIIMISYKWAGEETVHNLRWSSAKRQCDKKLLKDFSKIYNSADLVVYHNGDKFDLPWVNTRLLYHDLPRLDPVPSEDTLKLIRPKFNFPSNRLDAVGAYLGVGRKLRTGGIDLWKDVVFGKDQEALEFMAEYCDQDVLLLEEVHKKIVPHTNRKESFFGPGMSHCRECGSDSYHHNRTRYTKAGNPRVTVKCNNCHSCRTMAQSVYDKLVEEKSE